MKPYRLFALILASFAALCACVPTISQMYNGPEVAGSVLRLSDLTPIKGATIAYQAADSSRKIATTQSDTQGHFTLRPVASTQFEVRMPSYSHQRTPIYTSYPNYGNATDLVISVEMKREYERYNVGTIILDDTPNVLAAPLTDDAVDIQLLTQTDGPYQFLHRCHGDDTAGAINKLNITRKLARRVWQADGALPRRATIQLQHMKQQTEHLWQYLANTCKTTPSIKLATLKFRVIQELQAI